MSFFSFSFFFFGFWFLWSSLKLVWIIWSLCYRHSNCLRFFFGSTLGALHPRVAGLNAILKPLLVYLLVFIVELWANFAHCLTNVTAWREMTERDTLRESKQDCAMDKFSDSCSTEIDLKVQKRPPRSTKNEHEMRCGQWTIANSIVTRSSQAEAIEWLFTSSHWRSITVSRRSAPLKTPAGREFIKTLSERAVNSSKHHG